MSTFNEWFVINYKPEAGTSLKEKMRAAWNSALILSPEIKKLERDLEAEKSAYRGACVKIKELTTPQSSSATEQGETPRTDAFYATLYDARVSPDLVEAASGKERDFARQLERELFTANDEWSIRLAQAEREIANLRKTTHSASAPMKDELARVNGYLRAAMRGNLSETDVAVIQAHINAIDDRRQV